MITLSELAELRRLRQLKLSRGLTGDETYILEMQRLRELEASYKATSTTVHSVARVLERIARTLDAATVDLPDYPSSDWKLVRPE